MNLPILALIVANTIWGAAPPIFKLALQNMPPFTLAFIRFFGAALIFLPAMIVGWRKISLYDFFKVCVASFLGVFLHIAFFFFGLQRGVSIDAGIIVTSGPLFLFLLAVVFLREKPETKVMKGMFIALFGVIFIVFSPVLEGGGGMTGGSVVGNLLFVAATICLVISTILSKKILTVLNPYQFIFIFFAFSALCFLPFSLGELKTWSFDSIDSRGVLGVVFGLFVSSAAAYFLYFWGAAKIKAQEIGIFSYIDPVMTVIVAIPLLGEYPTFPYLIGALLVFAGIFVAEGRIHWHPFNRLRKN